jgi:hypothetical protein
MVKGSKRVVIGNEAKTQLRQAYNYIKKDSEQNAEKVKHKKNTGFHQSAE